MPSRYLGLASAAALLAYVEHIQCMAFVPRSLRVNWHDADGHLVGACFLIPNSSQPVHAGSSRTRVATICLYVSLVQFWVFFLFLVILASPLCRSAVAFLGWWMQAMDFQTIKSLELLSHATGTGDSYSLFASMNFTKVSQLPIPERVKESISCRGTHSYLNVSCPWIQVLNAPQTAWSAVRLLDAADIRGPPAAEGEYLVALQRHQHVGDPA